MNLFSKPITDWTQLTMDERMENIRNHYRQYPLRDLRTMLAHMEREVAFEEGKVQKFTKNGRQIKPKLPQMIEPWKMGNALMKEVIEEKEKQLNQNTK